MNKPIKLSDIVGSTPCFMEVGHGEKRPDQAWGSTTGGAANWQSLEDFTITDGVYTYEAIDGALALICNAIPALAVVDIDADEEYHKLCAATGHDWVLDYHSAHKGEHCGHIYFMDRRNSQLERKYKAYDKMEVQHASTVNSGGLVVVRDPGMVLHNLPHSSRMTDYLLSLKDHTERMVDSRPRQERDIFPVAELKDMLNQLGIKKPKFLDIEPWWFRAMCGATDEYGGTPLEMDAKLVFKEWSMQSSKFDEKYTESRWNSIIRKGYNGPRVTISSLIWEAGYERSAGVAPTGVNGLDRTSQESMALTISDQCASRFVFDDATDELLTWNSERQRWLAKNSDLHLHRFISRRIREEFGKDAKGLMSAANLNAVHKRVQVYLDREEFDVDPNVMGADNGLVVIGSEGEFSTEDDKQPSHLIRRTFDCTPSKTGATDNFDQFMDNISCERQEWVDFMLMLAKYQLLYENSIQKFWVYTGSGGNGKSVLCDVMQMIGGDFAGTLPREIFEEDKQHPVGKLLLRSLHVGFANEIARYRNSQLIKEVTGYDKIRARGMGEAYGEAFKSQCKLVFTSNRPPPIDRMDGGIVRRIEIVPFDWSISELPEDQRGVNIHNELKSERDAILGKILSQPDLTPENYDDMLPECIRQSTTEYLEQLDPFIKWLEDSCDEGGELRELLTKLYPSYRKYCEGVRKPMGKSAFQDQLAARGFERVPDMRAVVDGKSVRGLGYKGIMLKIEKKSLED